MFGLGTVIVAIKLGDRAASPQKTYGYYRAETFATMANAVLLALVSICIFYEAYQRLRHLPVIIGGWMLSIAVVGLAYSAFR